MSKKSSCAFGIIAALFVGAILVGAPGCGDEATQPAQTGQPTARVQFANTHCPLMGNEIDLDKVTPELTREFNGQKVAFCCAGCPAHWDKLSADEKATKLAQAKNGD